MILKAVWSVCILLLWHVRWLWCSVHSRANCCISCEFSQSGLWELGTLPGLYEYLGLLPLVLSSTFLLLYGGLTLVINSKFYLILVREHVLVSRVWLSATPWTVAHQTPLSLWFSRQEDEWVAILFSRASSWPRDWIRVSYITGRIFTSEPPGKPREHAMCCFSCFFFSVVCVLTSSVLHEKIYTVLNSEFEG